MCCALRQLREIRIKWGMDMVCRRKERKHWGRCFLFAILACTVLISLSGQPAQAARGTKVETSRAIGIVFDNSGSMYMGQNKAWCRATYAIEVFASMMNEGDVLQVYPMYDVTVGGRTYTSKTPFSISGGDDTSVIRSMYSPFAGDTPIETIGDVYAGLKETAADERWLIVLTDGAEFYENGENLKSAGTKTRLEEVLTEYNKDVNVLYLGIDSVAVMPEVESNGSHQYYADKAENSNQVLNKLTEMCNMIFGRDVLASSGNKLSFDVSMRKLILFVQGTDIDNVVLKDSSGASVGEPSQKYAPRYGELGTGSVSLSGAAYTNFGVDTSLSGYIAVYDTELSAGTYTLSYSGNVTNVSVYYEPDIDLNAALTDENGMLVDADSELYSGTYYINYGLMDKNGNTTSSTLLGKTNYVVTYTVNGEEHVVKSDASGQIPVELEEGDVLDGKFTVTYLSGYTITKDAYEFNWPFGGFKISPRPAGLLELQLTGGQGEYKLSELENTPYHVQLVYEGSPLTAERLADTELSISVEGGNAGYSLVQKDDGYDLYLQYAGTATQTDCGDYTLRLSAAYVNEYGVLSESKQVEVPFSVTDDGYGLTMELEGENYFVISKLESCDPILVKLSADGVPLTDEQLTNTVLTVESDGLTCQVEPVWGQSAFSLRIANDDHAKAGKYKLDVTATAQDQIGRDISAQDDMKVELSPYPQWLRVLVVVLILLLILLLIWLYMNMKVLPKKITVNASQSSLSVDGETVKGAPKCNFSGGNKKMGSITVTAPPYSGSALVKGGFALELQAVSPRRVKSNRRRVMVTRISPVNTGALQNLSIGTHSLSKSDDGDGVTWMLDGKQVPSAAAATKFEIGGKPTCTYSGETITGESFVLQVQLQFK